MTGLERRLARLEAATRIRKVFPMIVVSFVHPGHPERPIRSMTINDRIYHRAAAEPEHTFRARAIAEPDDVEGRQGRATARLVLLRC